MHILISAYDEARQITSLAGAITDETVAVVVATGAC